MMFKLTKAQMRFVIGSGTNDPPGDTEDPVTDIERVIVKGVAGQTWTVIDDPSAIEEFLNLSTEEFQELYEEAIIIEVGEDSALSEAVEVVVNNSQFQAFSVTVQKLILSSPLMTEALADYFKNPDGSTQELFNNSGQFDGSHISVLLPLFTSNDMYAALNAVISLAHELGHFVNNSMNPSVALSDANYVYERAKYEMIATSVAMNWISQMVREDPSLANFVTTAMIPYGYDPDQFQAMMNGSAYSLSENELDALVKNLLLNQNQFAGTGAGYPSYDWDGASGINYIEKYLSDKYKNPSMGSSQRKAIYDDVRNSISSD